KQQDLLHLRPAPQQRAVVAVGGKDNVLRTHGAGDADRNRLLAERNGVGPEPSCPLQRDGLEIKRSCQHHAAIKRDEDAGVGGKAGEGSKARAVGWEIVGAASLEACNDGEPFVGQGSLSLNFSLLLLASRRRKSLPPAVATGFAIKLRDSAPADKLFG